MLTESLQAYLSERVDPRAEALPKDRRHALRPLVERLRESRLAGETARFVFICTHNSRRSHLAQIWAATCAHLEGVALQAFSGGTETTEVAAPVLAALERAGFLIDSPSGPNPHHAIRGGADAEPIVAFSKRFDDAPNPAAEFTAVMVCSEADQGCPHVPGATARIALPYLDPKVADGTPQEQAAYDERCLQIAAEMRFVMTNVAKVSAGSSGG